MIYGTGRSLNLVSRLGGLGGMPRRPALVNEGFLRGEDRLRYFSCYHYEEGRDNPSTKCIEQVQAMKRVYCVYVAILCGASGFVAADCRADQAADEAAIRKNDEAYVAAYNKHDAKAIASMWSPEAVYMDPETGEAAVGRDAIEKVFAGTLANLKDAKLEIDVKSIQFVSPNVAIETGVARVVRPETKPEMSHYSAVNVKRDGKWLLDRISEEEPPTPPPSNYEHLKDLDWMVGSWIDRDDKATVQTDCEWTKNKNFMTRSFAMSIGDRIKMAGMQIVGWDPVAKQIRSWVFDSDGGFSEGKWKRKGDRWLIQQVGTLPDGGKSSAVNVLKKVDNNSFTWQSIERSVDGEPLPNVDEVLIVRKPAE
jgi:uncharacterized protein (TIGR02246 family)